MMAGTSATTGCWDVSLMTFSGTASMMTASGDELTSVAIYYFLPLLFFFFSSGVAGFCC
jgi:hypothetical protein